jgi:hypothetical protein
VWLRTVESSRLETVAALCLQRFRPRSNKSSSRLEMGFGCGRQRLARENLREWNMPTRVAPPGVADTGPTPSAGAHAEGAWDKSVARASVGEGSERTLSMPCPVVAETWTARFSFDCPSPNLPKIITIYASTSLREIQGLEGCGQSGRRDENLKATSGDEAQVEQKFRGARSKPGPFKHRRDPAPREFQSCFKRSPVPRAEGFATRRRTLKLFSAFHHALLR